MEGVVYRDNSPYPCLVSRWMSMGTASKYCAETINNVDFLKFVSRYSYFLSGSIMMSGKISGISDGLSYMHQEGIAHGDIRGVFFCQVSLKCV